jgi:AMIN domain
MLKPFLSSALFIVCLPVLASGQASIRRVHALASKDAVEIEIEGSDRLNPQTQVLANPDRLVVDFPNAVPGIQLRNESVNRGQLKDFRISLFQAKPPMTRLVLDFATAPAFQVFPSGRNVIIKVVPPNTQPQVSEDAGPLDDFPPARPGVNADASQQPRQLDVSFRNGLLAIRAIKVSLSEVLYAVHQRTGADVAIAAGAEQEQVVTEIGPGPAPVVLARLLNGSRFNFLILSPPNNPQGVEKIVLSPRGEGGGMPMSVAVSNGSDDDEPPPPVASVPVQQPMPEAQPQPNPVAPPTAPPDAKAQPDISDGPD